MKEIGLSLKEKREENGVTIEEAAEDLKLRPSQIVAIEEGNIKEFKDVFYLKHFIRDYAKYLNLDPDKLVDEFNEYLFDYTSKIPLSDIETAKNTDDSESKKIASPYTNAKKERAKIPAFYIYVFIGILVLAILFILINNYEKNNAKTADSISVMGG